MDTGSTVPDTNGFNTWNELVEATRKACQERAKNPADQQSIRHQDTESLLLRECQAQSFPEEVAALWVHKPVSPRSQLSCLAPEWDPTLSIVRVGGRLWRLQNANLEEIHPIVLDPGHPTTKLVIKEFDERLLHPGVERVYAELRRQYWIL